MLKRCFEFVSSNKQWAILLRARVLHNKLPVMHHISSSIWAGLRSHLNTVLHNSKWLIGDGYTIDFWKDCWLSQPLVDCLNIPKHMHHLLQSNISDFISNGKWVLPQELIQRYPVLPTELNQVIIPKFCSADSLVWIATDSGLLSLKDAFFFQNPNRPHTPWCKLIWSSSVPPSKSFLLWRILHNKCPTDDQLWMRGCLVVSVCSICGKAYESTMHLFFGCSFANRLWNWLSSFLSLHVDSSSLQSILIICNGNWSSQVKDIIVAAIVNIVWVIWFCRNKLRFDGKRISYEAAINMIHANISLAGNLSSGHMSSNIQELAILKRFSVAGKLSSAPKIKEVNWYPPNRTWIKVNSDGAAKGSPGPAACGGIFRDSNSAILGCFACNIGPQNSLFAELMGAIIAIEVAHKRGWRNLWLECDSKLVIDSFSNPNIVPWKLKNRWLNCMVLSKEMFFLRSHIYREGNNCADKLANFGTTIHGMVWWDLAPSFILHDFSRDRTGLPNYRFS